VHRLPLIAVLTVSVLVAAPAASLSPILKELEATYVQLGEKLLPSVVNIDVTSRPDASRRTPGGDLPEDIFRFFDIAPDERERPRPERIPSQGSGFVFDEDGHIITNSHVVSNAESITVRLHDGREYEGTLIGADAATDIAVIKVVLNEGESLAVTSLGNSDTLKVGQFAVAIGSPRGLEGSMSFGHISALGRDGLNLPGLDYQGFIQTDAAINLGNSGGPLCDIDGRVIGINTAIISGANAIGFAIPINMAKKIVPMLINQGRVSRGFLGVNISDAADFAVAESMPFTEGAYVENVENGSPAERAGVRVYDVIRKVGDVSVRDAMHLRDTISDYPPEAEVVLEVWRGGTTITMTARLGDRAKGVTAAEPEAVNLLGIEVQELSADIRSRLQLQEGTAGVLVGSVQEDGPAHAAGIRPGAVLLEIGKTPVPTLPEYLDAVRKHVTPGALIIVRVAPPGGGSRVLIIDVPGDNDDGEDASDAEGNSSDEHAP
jgi:serine protease Do